MCMKKREMQALFNLAIAQGLQTVGEFNEFVKKHCNI